jgi:hypothetical protein
MIRAILLIAFLAATPAAAQTQQTHSHAGAGHDDLDDVRVVLRAVAVNQMRYNAQHGRYATTLRELGLPASRVVTVWIVANGSEGFSAVSESSTETCVFFSGRVPRPRDDARANEVVCRRRASQ